MSSADPGSWPPNWLHGTPITVNPREPYFCCSSSSAVYWGVSPHRDATLTTRAARPSRISWSVVGRPSKVLISGTPPRYALRRGEPFHDRHGRVAVPLPDLGRLLVLRRVVEGQRGLVARELH